MMNEDRTWDDTTQSWWLWNDTTEEWEQEQEQHEVQELKVKARHPIPFTMAHKDEDSIEAEIQRSYSEEEDFLDHTPLLSSDDSPFFRTQPNRAMTGDLETCFPKEGIGGSSGIEWRKAQSDLANWHSSWHAQEKHLPSRKSDADITRPPISTYSNGIMELVADSSTLTFDPVTGAVVEQRQRLPNYNATRDVCQGVSVDEYGGLEGCLREVVLRRYQTLREKIERDELQRIRSSHKSGDLVRRMTFRDYGGLQGCLKAAHSLIVKSTELEPAHFAEALKTLESISEGERTATPSLASSQGSARKEIDNEYRGGIETSGDKFMDGIRKKATGKTDLATSFANAEISTADRRKMTRPKLKQQRSLQEALQEAIKLRSLKSSEMSYRQASQDDPSRYTMSSTLQFGQN